jgi:hypothetical protein
VHFRDQIREEKARVDEQLKMVSQVVEREVHGISQRIAKKPGAVFPPYYYKAVQRYKSYEDHEGAAMTKKLAGYSAKYLSEWGKLKAAFWKDLSAEKDRFERESKNGENYYNCEREMAIISKYVTEINRLNTGYNEQLVKDLVTRSYHRFYYMTAVAVSDATALKMVLELKSTFLQKLLELKHESYPPNDCIQEKDEVHLKKAELPDYDEVNCNILNTVTWPGWGCIVMRCNNMTMSINSSLLPAGGSITANFDGYVEQFSVAAKVKAVDIEIGAQFDKQGNFVSANGGVSSNIKGIDVSVKGEAGIDEKGNQKGSIELGLAEHISVKSEVVVDENGFKKGSVELGIDGELKFLPEGLEGEAPVELGLKGELGVGMEFDSEGNTEFIVKQKTEGEIASNVEVDDEIELVPGMMTKGGKVTEPEKLKLPLPAAPSVSISADNQWSVNSGFSTGKGSLSGLSHK